MHQIIHAGAVRSAPGIDPDRKHRNRDDLSRVDSCRDGSSRGFFCFQEERMVDAPNGSVQHVEKAGLIPKYINKKVCFHTKGPKNS